MRAPRPAHRPAYPSCYRRRARGYTFKALWQACNGICARGHAPFPDAGGGSGHSGHAAGRVPIQRRSKAARGGGAVPQAQCGRAGPCAAAVRRRRCRPELGRRRRRRRRAVRIQPPRLAQDIQSLARHGNACVRGHDGGPRRPRVREGGRALREHPVPGRAGLDPRNGAEKAVEKKQGWPAANGGVPRQGGAPDPPSPWRACGSPSCAGSIRRSPGVRRRLRPDRPQPARRRRSEQSQSGPACRPPLPARPAAPRAAPPARHGAAHKGVRR